MATTEGARAVTSPQGVFPTGATGRPRAREEPCYVEWSGRLGRADMPQIHPPVAKAKTAQVYLLLGVMLLLWSANFIFAKLATRELPLLMVLGARYVLAGLFMWPVYLVAVRRQDAPPASWRMRDLPVLIGWGVTGLVGNQLLFVAGISLTSVTHASMITALSPVLVLLGAAADGQERITPRRVLGILMALSGIVVLQLGKERSGGATLRGDALMIASSLVFSAFSLFGKRQAAKFGSLTMNVFAYCSAGVLALPVLIRASLSGAHPWRASAAAWTGVVYMAVLTSVVGYLIYAYALRHFPASHVAGTTYLLPILASLLAIAILGERPAPTLAPAALLVLAGLYQVQRAPHPAGGGDSLSTSQ